MSERACFERDLSLSPMDDPTDGPNDQRELDQARYLLVSLPPLNLIMPFYQLEFLSSSNLLEFCAEKKVNKKFLT